MIKLLDDKWGTISQKDLITPRQNTAVYVDHYWLHDQNDNLLCFNSRGYWYPQCNAQKAVVDIFVKKYPHVTGYVKLDVAYFPKDWKVAKRIKEDE